MQCVYTYVSAKTYSMVIHLGGWGGSRWSSRDTVLITPNMTADFTQSYTRFEYAKPAGGKTETIRV